MSLEEPGNYHFTLDHIVFLLFPFVLAFLQIIIYPLFCFSFKFYVFRGATYLTGETAIASFFLFFVLAFLQIIIYPRFCFSFKFSGCVFGGARYLTGETTILLAFVLAFLQIISHMFQILRLFLWRSPVTNWWDYLPSCHWLPNTGQASIRLSISNSLLLSHHQIQIQTHLQ